LTAYRLGQFLRSHSIVCIADSPELFWITEIPRRDVVEALTFGNCVKLQEVEAVCLGNESTTQVDHCTSSRLFEMRSQGYLTGRLDRLAAAAASE